MERVFSDVSWPQLSGKLQVSVIIDVPSAAINSFETKFFYFRINFLKTETHIWGKITNQ